MKKIVLAALTGMVAALAGCLSPNTPLTIPGLISLSTSQPGLVHLEPGGLAIRSIGDTAVNFDLVSHVSVQNDSNVTLHLLAKWVLTGDTTAIASISTIVPNESNTPPVIDSGTVDLGIVPSGSSVAIDSIPIVTLDSILPGSQVDYLLQFQVQNGPALAFSYAAGFPMTTITNYNLSVPFSSRWRGIENTTTASPNPIGIIDGPDDSDWQATSLFTPSPAYPNPAINATTLGISIPSQLDSVTCQLFITPHHILQTIADGTFGLGTRTFQANLSTLSPGLYRAIWTGHKNGTAVSSHGDIMVPWH